jgi:hypothetical protein
MPANITPVISQGYSAQSFIVTAIPLPPVSSFRIRTSRDVAEIARTLGLEVLEIKLYVKSGEDFSFDSLNRTLEGCPNLRTLDLSGFQLNNTEIQRMCSIVRTSSVQNLILKYNQYITRECLDSFLEMPTIRLVDLRNCPRITSLDAQSLIERSPHLQVLSEGFSGYEGGM